MLPTKKVGGVIHHSGGRLAMGTRKWWKCYSGGTTSTATNQITMTKDRSGVLSGIGTREW